MKQTAWTPSSLNPSVTLGEKIAVSSVLSIDTHSALINPAILSPVPSIPFRVKSHTGNLHIHPAFSFRAGIRYFVGSAKLVTTDKNGAVTYIGTGRSDGGLNADIRPVNLSITSVPGNIAPDDVVLVEYDYSAVWNIEVYYQINAGDPVFYGTYPATGSVAIDTAGIEFEHLDQFRIIIKDLDSVLFDDITYNVVVKALSDLILSNLHLIPEFADGVDYYATPTGIITTDITETYVGKGNSNKNIDLDIIKYAINISSPIASTELGIDVPFSLVLTTNIQDGRTINFYAQKSGGSKILIGSDTIVAGGITVSLTLASSDGFADGDNVTITADYASSVVTKTVAVVAKTASITGLATDPESPVEANDFVMSGNSAYLVGKTLNLYSSPDNVTFDLIGTAVVQPDGTWSATVNIASAGSYYLKAFYGIVIWSDSLSVTVLSAGIKVLGAMENGLLVEIQNNKTTI